MKTLYTAEALASGEGRDGNARTNDGKLDVALASPVELGGATAKEPTLSSCSQPATPRASTRLCDSWVARNALTSATRPLPPKSTSVR